MPIFTGHLEAAGGILRLEQCFGCWRTSRSREMEMHVAISTLECRENAAGEKSAFLLLRERMKTKAEQKEQTFSCFYF